MQRQACKELREHVQMNAMELSSEREQHQQFLLFFLGFCGGSLVRESYAQCVGYYYTVAEHHGLA